nr:DUF4249 domain-containing protein [Pedobacter panaciterrae]
MKNLKIYFPALLIALALTSCEKVIDLKLGDDTGKLVIEGNLTNIKGTQLFKLTTNIPFTNKNTYPPVTGAIINLKDEKGNTYPMVETSHGNYTANDLAGIPGDAYTMNVFTSGKTYTARSMMPAAVTLDSITTKISDFDAKKRQVIIHYQDPPGIVNQYRVVMFVNHVQVKAVFAYNDDFNDGKYVHNEIRQQDIDVYPNDKITIEMQCIDKPVYTYWFTIMQQSESGPGGSVTPSNPPTNIGPTTLGYFSAHTTQTVSVIVK